MIDKFSRQEGFSLVETIVYVSLTVVVLVVGINLLFTILGSREEIRPRRIVEDESSFVLENIAYFVRQSEAVFSTTSTSTLVLKMADDSLDPTQFSLKDQKVAIKQGEDPWRYITSDQVEVLKLEFEDLTPEESPGVVRIILRLKPIPALGGRPEIEVKTTAMARE